MVKDDDEKLRILMANYQAGSLDAFQRLYGSLAPELDRYLRYLVQRSGFENNADDLVQETFLRLHRSRSAYNPAYAVRPWLFGLARNVFLMQRRAARRFWSVHSSDELPEIPVPPDVDSLGSAGEIRRSIARLPEDQAEALLLHHMWGFTFDEIAGMVGVTSAAARARASRGMAELRHTMSQSRRVGA